MPACFAITLLLSSALVFLIQPMFARMVLPLLGGAPAVWNTCMLFFQSTLLAGYAYAHVAPAWLGVRRQAMVHLGLMLLPALVLPVSVRGSADQGDMPFVWLLQMLVLSVGLPYFVVCASGPMLQRWFAATGQVSAHDPYYLYAASNLGSMLALLSYPLLLEPALPLVEQTRLWTGAYVVLIGMTALCAFLLIRSPVQPRPESVDDRNTGAAPRWGERLRWMLLAFVPSSLMMSVTTYITTDVAAIPLLWVLPLSLYLLTFIVAFARRQMFSPASLARGTPLVVLILVLTLLSEATEPALLLIALHLGGLFWLGLMCHVELSQRRPDARHLTEFYLWLAVGGTLAGLFNALLAPLLFNAIAEYPFVLVLACLLRPMPGNRAPTSGEDTLLGSLAKDALPAAVLGGSTPVLALLARSAWGQGPSSFRLLLMYGIPIVGCYTLVDRRLRFALGVAAVLLAGSFNTGIHGATEYRIRSFFGVHRVTRDVTNTFRLLVHGNTVHGQQHLDPEHGCEPLIYYHREGPAGNLFAALDNDPRLDRVALVGLGTGALACYAKPGQHWTFYEIDPAVVFIARDSGLFSYWRQSTAELDVVIGDARLTLAQGHARYGMIVVDAFTSDAIPLHLLTREALAVYRSRLTDDGLLLFHVSNRYLELTPVLANLAADADPPLFCLSRASLNVTAAERRAGLSAAHWLVLTPRRADGVLLGRHLWFAEQPTAGAPVWTDDYTNLFGVLKWQ